MAELSFPKRPYRTKGGVHAPHNKNTAHKESVMLPVPSMVALPMTQHIGAPCKPLVKVGDIVDVGQKIAGSDAFVSAPIHASVSGKVKKIDKITMPDGGKVDAIFIESDGEQRLSPDIKPPKVDTLSDLITAVRESGLVGLGGAGFPTSVKLNIPSDKNVDTLIINVAECEPYITSDHREILENSWDVVSGIITVKEFLNIHRVIIGIENNKPDAIKALREIADSKVDPEDEIRVLPIKATYPQGAEKILIKACTGREVPVGGLPSDAGCLVMNVGSIAFISRYLKTGIPLISRRLTVDGGCIENPVNVIAPIGTPIYAANSGTVLYTSNDCTHSSAGVGACNHGGGYGNHVWIQHDNGYQTIYGHMINTAVSPGEYVSKGQLIGYSGSTGWSTGPHLHFELRINGVRSNPMALF